MINGNEIREIDNVFCKVWNQRELRTFVVGSVIPMVSRSRSGWSLVVKPWESKASFVRSIVQGSSAMYYVQSIEKIINHNSITIDAKGFWIHLKWVCNAFLSKVIYLLDRVQQKEVPFSNWRTEKRKWKVVRPHLIWKGLERIAFVMQDLSSCFIEFISIIWCCF